MIMMLSASAVSYLPKNPHRIAELQSNFWNSSSPNPLLKAGSATADWSGLVSNNPKD